MYQPCHCYTPALSDDGVSTVGVWGVYLPCNDNAFQNLTNVNPLQKFAVTWNWYFRRRYESHLESRIVHMLLKSDFFRKKGIVALRCCFLGFSYFDWYLDIHYETKKKGEIVVGTILSFAFVSQFRNMLYLLQNWEYPFKKISTFKN